ncbi:diaminopimelate decarboxylase [Bacillus sp. UMB0728]|nr:diaminopimelate decarboxylase [Bacillus sp. UMB0728]
MKNKNVVTLETLEYASFNQLEKKFGTPLYIFNVDKLRENYRNLENTFETQYQNLIIGYSYKTNYLPHICKELSLLGAYAEVVSRLEYDLAIEIGEDPRRIIFNGPLKSKEDVQLALENESIINLDSFYEIDYVNEYALNNPKKLIKIGLRVNFDISLEGFSPLQNGYEVSRFGFCVENGDVIKAIAKINVLNNIKIVGFHGHFSTKDRSVETYRKITINLCKLAKEYISESVEYIDVGGGMYGELPSSFGFNAPTFQEYAEVIGTIMNKEFCDNSCKPYLIIEPGMSMVANVFSFMAKVMDTKEVRGKQFVLLDGSVHNIKPTMHQRNLPMKIVRQHADGGNKRPFEIVGYTCMEKDYLAHDVHDELPLRGDYVIFHNVGAYTIVFNPPFIKGRPSIIALEEGKVYITRRAETFRQFFNEEIYCFPKGGNNEYLNL